MSEIYAVEGFEKAFTEAYGEAFLSGENVPASTPFVAQLATQFRRARAA